MTKVDLTQDELKILISLISQVQVTVDTAEKLIVLRRKINNVVQAAQTSTGEHSNSKS